MNSSRLLQFRVILAFTIILGLSVGGYIVWAIVDFNSRHALSESQFLSKFTARSISRVQANPHHFNASGEQISGKMLGNARVNLFLSYESLKSVFPEVPAKKKLKNNHTRAVTLKYRGLFKPPNYLLVHPVFLADGTEYYGYLQVDDRYNDSELDFRILEKSQPAIIVALMCIFFLTLIELYHINKVNSTVNQFASWASNLKAGEKSTSRPNFSSSKLNYMAYAIDKSLSGISEVLEQEQSFVKFTSHELRTPIAVLSANMEVLELLMKDLSGKERSVLKNMESAVSDMKYQMEALLWLSRENESNIDVAACCLKEMVEKSLHDNAYLNDGDDIATSVNGEKTFVQSNPVVLQIILNNLVRNAFQHTQSGSVEISISSQQLIIANNDNGNKLTSEKKAGFGIGLVLVEKLVRKLQLRYSVEKRQNGRRVTLVFPEKLFFS